MPERGFTFSHVALHSCQWRNYGPSQQPPSPRPRALLSLADSSPAPSAQELDDFFGISNITTDNSWKSVSTPGQQAGEHDALPQLAEPALLQNPANRSRYDDAATNSAASACPEWDVSTSYGFSAAPVSPRTTTSSSIAACMAQHGGFHATTAVEPLSMQQQQQQEQLQAPGLTHIDSMGSASMVDISQVRCRRSIHTTELRAVSHTSGCWRLRHSELIASRLALRSTHQSAVFHPLLEMRFNATESNDSALHNVRQRLHETIQTPIPDAECHACSCWKHVLIRFPPQLDPSRSKAIDTPYTAFPGMDSCIVLLSNRFRAIPALCCAVNRRR